MLALNGWERLVPYIPTALFLLIFSFSLIIGLIRGLRKSVILFINMIIAYGISLIIFFIIFGSNFDENAVRIYNILAKWFSWNGLGELFGTGIEHTRLSDYFLDFAVNKMDFVIYDNASISTVVKLLFVIAHSCVKILAYFVILIVYYILKFILYIVYLLFFKQKRYMKKVKKNFALGISTKEYKPHHLWGMAVGALRGILVGVVQLSFIGSCFFMLTNGKYSDKDLIEEDLIVADSFRINSLVEMVNRYGTVGVGQVLESIGTKSTGPWYLLIADSIVGVDYEVDISGDIIEETFVARKELGPICGAFKDCYLIFREYNVDFTRLNDPNYLSEALGFEYNGMTLADRLDSFICNHEFGKYTINLCQAFLNAVMANLPRNEDGEIDVENDFAGQILYYAFEGEHAIKASTLITEDSISSALSLTLTILANYKEIQDFGNQFAQNNTQQVSLAFGFKRDANTVKSYEGVSKTLTKIGDFIGQFEGIKDGLITDIVLALLDRFSPDGLSNVNIPSSSNPDYIRSSYQVKWKNNLRDICNVLSKFISHISQNNLYNVDSLLRDVIDNIDKPESQSRVILDTILDADFSGVILNNPNVLSIISDSINQATNGIISLSNNLTLGTYYDESGVKKDGDLTKIIKNLIGEAKDIYQIVMDNQDDPNLMVKKLLTNDKLTDKLVNIVDDDHEYYSKTLHSVVSSVLLNINKVIPGSVGFNIVIEDKYVDNQLIDSAELTASFKSIVKYVPLFLDESFNYKTDISLGMINDLAALNLIKATIAEALYYGISQTDKIKDYIPDTYQLGVGNEANIELWTRKNGELDQLVKLINVGSDQDTEGKKSVFDLLINFNEDVDIITELLSYDYDELNNIETALLETNVVNPILVGFIQDLTFDNVKIRIPNLCLGAVGDKKKIKSDLNIFTLLKETDLYSLIKSEDVTEIVTFLFESNIIESIFSNKIINSIFVQILSSLDTNIKIIVPKTSYTTEALLSGDKIIKTAELTGAIDILKNVFKKTEDGKYDLNNIDLNKVFNISLEQTDIIGATISNIIINQAKDPIKIPTTMKNAELETDYVDSGWKEEIISIIDGFKALNLKFDDESKVDIKINDVVLNLNNVEDGFSKSNLERMYSSQVLKLTLYNAVTSLSNDAILIPLDAIATLYDDEDKYIVYEEIKTLADAVITLGITDVENFDVKELFKNSEKLDSLNDILSSSMIIRYTATSYLNKNENLIFVPDIAYDTQTKSKMVSINEASALIDIIKICGDLDNFNFNNIFEKTADKIIEIINGSSIIRSTITNNLKKSNSIKIPECSYDVDAALYSNDLIIPNRNKMLSKEEVEGIVSVIKSLNITTTEDFDYDKVFSLDKNLLFDCIEKSTALRCTIGLKLNDEDVGIPQAAYEQNISVNERLIEEDRLFESILKTSEFEALFDIIVKCGKTAKDFNFNVLFEMLDDVSETINSSYILRYNVTNKIPKDYISVPKIALENIYGDDFILKEEITILFDIIKDCGGTTEGFDFNSLFNKVDNLSGKVNESYILRYTVTNKMPSSVDVPYAALESIKDELFITQGEISVLFNVIDLCGGTTEDFDFNKLLLSSNVSSIINSSYILRYTVTRKMPEDVIQIPYEALEDLSVYNTVSQNTKEYALTNNEVSNLFDGIKALGLANTDSFDFDNFLSINAVNIINNSLVLRYTVTNNLRNTDIIVLTKDTLDLDYVSNIVKKNELLILVETINILGVTSLDSIDVSIGKISSNIDTILASNILHATISDQMYSAGCKLDLEFNTITNLIDDSNPYYLINREYIKEYIDTIIEVVGADATYGVDIDLSIDTESKINKMAQSRIVLLTYSDDIFAYVDKLNGLLDSYSLSMYKIDKEYYKETISNIVMYSQEVGFEVKDYDIITNVDELIAQLHTVSSMLGI